MAVEIYFDDLSPEKQKEIEEECGLESGEDGNWEFSPLFVYEVEKDEIDG